MLPTEEMRHSVPRLEAVLRQPVDGSTTDGDAAGVVDVDESLAGAVMDRSSERAR